MPGLARVLLVLLTSHLLTDAGSTLSWAQTVEPAEFVTVTFEDGNAEAAVEVPQPIADDAIPRRLVLGDFLPRSIPGCSRCGS